MVASSPSRAKAEAERGSPKLGAPRLGALEPVRQLRLQKPRGDAMSWSRRHQHPWVQLEHPRDPSVGVGKATRTHWCHRCRAEGSGGPRPRRSLGTGGAGIPPARPPRLTAFPPFSGRTWETRSTRLRRRPRPPRPRGPPRFDGSCWRTRARGRITPASPPAPYPSSWRSPAPFRPVFGFENLTSPVFPPG